MRSIVVILAVTIAPASRMSDLGRVHLSAGQYTAPRARLRQSNFLLITLPDVDRF